MPKPRKRSSATKRRFLAKRGYKKTPRGKEVHHKKPLAVRGKDDPRNLKLRKKSAHKKETKKLIRKLKRKK